MTEVQATTLLEEITTMRILLQGVCGILMLVVLVAVIYAFYKFFKIFF